MRNGIAVSKGKKGAGWTVEKVQLVPGKPTDYFWDLRCVGMPLQVKGHHLVNDLNASRCSESSERGANQARVGFKRVGNVTQLLNASIRVHRIKLHGQRRNMRNAGDVPSGSLKRVDQSRTDRIRYFCKDDGNVMDPR